MTKYKGIKAKRREVKCRGERVGRKSEERKCRKWNAREGEVC
jgi:hypothetical protein